jgi:hypothetical protein
MLAGVGRHRLEIAVLALALQSTLSLESLGIATRIAASHVLLPYFAVAILVGLFTSSRYALAIRWRWVAAFFFAALVLMAHGLQVGRDYTGEVSAWGERRAVSTVLMLAYLMVGVYVGARGEAARDGLALAFAACAWLIGALTYAAYLLASMIDAPIPVLLYPSYSRLQGLMDNPNAFGWIVVCALCFHLAYLDRGRGLWHRLSVPGLAVLIAVAVLAASKSAWLGALVGSGIVVAIRRPPLRPVAVALVLGAALSGIGAIAPAPQHSDSFIADLGESSLAIDSVALRIDQFRLAIELIGEHPIWGIGLGSFPWEEARRGMRVWHYLHNSVLWLWTELGPLAVVLFLAFFAYVVRAIWPRPRSRGNDPFAVAVFAILWAFAAISAADEVIYQRYLWVFVGAALAVPVSARAAVRPRHGTGEPPTRHSDLPVAGTGP